MSNWSHGTLTASNDFSSRTTSRESFGGMKTAAWSRLRARISASKGRPVFRPSHTAIERDVSKEIQQGAGFSVRGVSAGGWCRSALRSRRARAAGAKPEGAATLLPDPRLPKHVLRGPGGRSPPRTYGGIGRAGIRFTPDANDG